MLFYNCMSESTLYGGYGHDKKYIIIEKRKRL